jgi:hypothetical protein
VSTHTPTVDSQVPCDASDKPKQEIKLTHITIHANPMA